MSFSFLPLPYSSSRALFSVRLADQSEQEPQSPPSPPSPPLSPSLNQDPSVAPSHLPPPSSSSSSRRPPYPFVVPEIEAQPHPDSASLAASEDNSSSKNGQEKEGSQGPEGTLVDPHQSDEPAERGIEEKIIDLMGEIEEENEFKKGDRGGVVEGDGQEAVGRKVKVAGMGETDL